MWVATAVFVAVLVIFMFVAMVVIFMIVAMIVVAVFNFAHGDVVTNHEDVAA